jgi:hypothetical protein
MTEPFEIPKKIRSSDPTRSGYQRFRIGAGSPARPAREIEGDPSPMHKALRRPSGKTEYSERVAPISISGEPVYFSPSPNLGRVNPFNCRDEQARDDLRPHCSSLAEHVLEVGS